MSPCIELESTEFSAGKTARNGPKNDVSVIWLFYHTPVERSGASQNGQDPRKSPKNHSMAMQELGTLKKVITGKVVAKLRDFVTKGKYIILRGAFSTCYLGSLVV
jgi:hypothetical protein